MALLGATGYVHKYNIVLYYINAINGTTLFFFVTDVIDDRDLSPEEAHGVPLEDDEIAPHRINLINWDPVRKIWDL